MPAIEIKTPLKTCPFCDGDAYAAKFIGKYNENGKMLECNQFSIGCNNVGCCSILSITDCGPYINDPENRNRGYETDNAALDALTKKWNTRKGESQ